MSASTQMQPSLPVRMKARRNMLFIVLLVVLMTVVVLPSQAFAMVENDGGASAPACATTTSTQVDYTTCLPSGRWGSNVGSITSRIEPSSGILGFIANVPAMISHTTRDILPNMLMQITQLCWSCALSLSQFAASFTPLKTAGASVDHATANLIDSVMAGGIPAALMVTAIVVWLLAAGFDIGTTKEASKRLLATVLCLAALIVLGTGASKTAENATEPATGSPWWVVNTINGAVNKLTVGLDLDGLNDGESNMMAFSNKALNRNTNCQDYLYAMHQQYDTATSGNGGDTSSITKAVNRMWEETALRSWVTMQWGNPSAGPNTPSGVADNAQQAYCHVLDMNTNTDPAVQMTLTNAATGLSIDSSTAEWLFSEHGWIDPQDSSVNDKEKEQNDRDKYVRLTRAGIFWETCGIDGSGKVYGRDGWNILVKNMGDKDTGAIKNGKLTVRLKKDGFSDISGGNGAHFYGDDVKVDQNILQLCNVALGTKQFKGDQYQAFHNDNDFRDSSGNVQNTDIADAANLGWRFDIPNVGGTWREANLGNTQDSSTGEGAMRITLDNLYGNSAPDNLGAFGSVLGGICNMIVWGLLSVILIMTKLMLVLMVLFLVVAFLVRAFPIGEAPKNVLKNWVKYTCNLSMTGGLYSALGAIATFICQLMLKFCSEMSSSFMYNVISGFSPVLAIAAISLFCTSVLKVGNPFSFKAMMGIATGGAMAGGVLAGLRRIGGGISSGLLMGRLLTSRNHGGMSSRNAGPRHRMFGPTAGESKLDSMLDSERKNLDLDGGDRNLYGRNAKEYDAIAARGADSLSYRWGRMNEGTVRGSLAGVAARFANQADRAQAFMTGGMSYDDRVKNYMARHPGASLGRARTMAKGASLLNQTARGLGGGAMLLGATGKAALGVMQSQPLRDVVKRGAKVAATGIAAAALTSNPITLPAGAVALGKLATNRDFWHGAKVGIGALGARAEKSRNEILSLGNRPTTVMTPIASVEDNPFDLDESLNEMHSEDGSLNSDGDKAFGVVENSMMHNFRQQGHMSEQEAADALESARITGEVKEAAAKYHANLNAPKNPPRQKTSDEFETDGDAF